MQKAKRVSLSKWCRGAESDCPRLRFQRSALPLSYLGGIKKVMSKIARKIAVVNTIIRPVFKGKLLKVFVKKERLPNGYLATFEMIKHPGASLVIPFLTKNKIIMLRQLRPVVNSYIYELPAGTLDENESPLSCARREIVEETGFSARKFTHLGKIYPVPGYSTEKISIFKAEGLKRQSRIVEKDEVIESRVFTRTMIKKLFKAGRIIDAKTISALAFCGWL